MNTKKWLFKWQQIARCQQVRRLQTIEIANSDIECAKIEIKRLQAIEQAVLNYLKADEDTVEECYYKLCAICKIEPDNG